MNKDFWERIDRLEELAELFADDKVSYGTYIGAANPAMIKEMIAEIRRLEKEADWLAKRCTKACVHKTEDCAFQPAYFMDKPQYGENCRKSFCNLNKSEWREAARKAVSEADNA